MTLLPLKLILRLVRDSWKIHIRSDQVICDREGWFSRKIPFFVSLWRGKSVKIYRSVLTVYRTSGPGLRGTSTSSPSWIFKFLISVVTLLVWHFSTKATDENQDGCDDFKDGSDRLQFRTLRTSTFWGALIWSKWFCSDRVWPFVPVKHTLY